MLKRHLLLTALISLATTLPASAGPSGPNQCISFDSAWNLLAFNFNGKDYSIPSTPNLSTSPAEDITSPSPLRPPFNAPASPPLCFLSQFANAIYVLNADAADPTSIYIYDVSRANWSKQATRLPAEVAEVGFDVTRGFGAILDRDTNVFFALSTGGYLVSLPMGTQQNATSEVGEWGVVQMVDFAEGYERPTMGLAQNHIHFMGVPGLGEGTDRVFVIHYSHLQLEPQTYTPPFPALPGRTASFFKDEGWQTQFAFIPSSPSSSSSSSSPLPIHVIDVTTNTTSPLPPPPHTDPHAQYAASPRALVQLSSEGGRVSVIGWDQEARRASGEGEGGWVGVRALEGGAGNTPERPFVKDGAATGAGNSSGSAVGGSASGAKGGEGNGVRGAGVGVGVGVVGTAVGLGAIAALLFGVL